MTSHENQLKDHKKGPLVGEVPLLFFLIFLSLSLSLFCCLCLFLLFLFLFLVLFFCLCVCFLFLFPLMFQCSVVCPRSNNILMYIYTIFRLLINQPVNQSVNPSIYSIKQIISLYINILYICTVVYSPAARSGHLLLSKGHPSDQIILSMFQLIAIYYPWW